MINTERFAERTENAKKTFLNEKNAVCLKIALNSWGHN